MGARDRDVEAVAAEEEVEAARDVLAGGAGHREEDDGRLAALEHVDGADADACGHGLADAGDGEVVGRDDHQVGALERARLRRSSSVTRAAGEQRAAGGGDRGCLLGLSPGCARRARRRGLRRPTPVIAPGGVDAPQRAGLARAQLVRRSCARRRTRRRRDACASSRSSSTPRPGCTTSCAVEQVLEDGRAGAVGGGCAWLTCGSCCGSPSSTTLVGAGRDGDGGGERELPGLVDEERAELLAVLPRTRAARRCRRRASYSSP